MTAGQTHDRQIADRLLDDLGPRTIVLADKAYDADRIRELVQNQAATPTFLPKSNRKWKPCFRKRLYRERNLIERFLSKLKHVRRVATRYDKLDAIFPRWSSSPQSGRGCVLIALRPCIAAAGCQRPQRPGASGRSRRCSTISTVCATAAVRRDQSGAGILHVVGRPQCRTDRRIIDSQSM